MRLLFSLARESCVTARRCLSRKVLLFPRLESLASFSAKSSTSGTIVEAPTYLSSSSVSALQHLQRYQPHEVCLADTAQSSSLRKSTAAAERYGNPCPSLRCYHATPLPSLTGQVIHREVHAAAYLRLGVPVLQRHGTAMRSSVDVTTERIEACSGPRRRIASRPDAQASMVEALTAPLEVSVERLADKDEGIALVSLQRPASKNAIGRVLLHQLRHAIENLRFDAATRVVILRSLVDGVFCAGADLKERRGMTPTEASKFVSSLRATFAELEALPMPTIAAVEGVALGGGLEMALACDLRVAGANAVFGLPETSLAIIPGAGGTQRLPRAIGRSRAKELVFTARRIDAKEAAALGLVDHAVGSGKAYERAVAIAREIVPRGPVAVRMAKLAIDRGCEVDASTGMAIEESCYHHVLKTDDRLEGLRAFAEKRAPLYKGE